MDFKHWMRDDQSQNCESRAFTVSCHLQEASVNPNRLYTEAHVSCFMPIGSVVLSLCSTLYRSCLMPWKNCLISPSPCKTAVIHFTGHFTRSADLGTEIHGCLPGSEHTGGTQASGFKSAKNSCNRANKYDTIHFTRGCF